MNVNFKDDFTVVGPDETGGKRCVTSSLVSLCRNALFVNRECIVILEPEDHAITLEQVTVRNKLTDMLKRFTYIKITGIEQVEQNSWAALLELDLHSLESKSGFAQILNDLIIFINSDAHVLDSLCTSADWEHHIEDSKQSLEKHLMAKSQIIGRHSRQHDEYMRVLAQSAEFVLMLLLRKLAELVDQTGLFQLYSKEDVEVSLAEDSCLKFINGRHNPSLLMKRKWKKGWYPVSEFDFLLRMNGSLVLLDATVSPDKLRRTMNKRNPIEAISERDDIQPTRHFHVFITKNTDSHLSRNFNNHPGVICLPLLDSTNVVARATAEELGIPGLYKKGWGPQRTSVAWH